MDEISTLRTEKAVKDALRTLPRSLYDTYARILSRIPASDIAMARRALLWLTWAFIPLSPSELAEAATFNTENDVVEADTRLTRPLDILEICGSLVMHDEALDKVQLAHHSLRDYLSVHLFDQAQSLLQLPDRQAHYEITNACLAYLLLRDFSSGWCWPKELESRLDRYPLLSYAAEFWPSHVEKSKAETELLPYILRLMKPSQTPHFLFWLQVVLSTAHGKRLVSAPGVRWNAQPLYYAASYGLTATVQSLVEAGANIDEKAGRFGGTALHAAAYRNHPEVVRVLLDAGADEPIYDDNGYAAVDYGRLYSSRVDNQKLISIFESRGQMARRSSFGLQPDSTETTTA